MVQYVRITYAQNGKTKTAWAEKTGPATYALVTGGGDQRDQTVSLPARHGDEGDHGV